MTRLEEQAIALFDFHRDNGSFTSSAPGDQIQKLLEEVGEFVGAIVRGDTDNALEEAGDVAWLLVDILNVAGSRYQLAVGMAAVLDKLVQRHGGPPLTDPSGSLTVSRQDDQQCPTQDNGSNHGK